MKTEKEIRDAIKQLEDFINNMEHSDYIAKLELNDAKSWANALEWVLEES